jgi:carbonic anhydrase/acetyltransferase-like protein (isoleucine patch superfamily)
MATSSIVSKISSKAAFISPLATIPTTNNLGSLSSIYHFARLGSGTKIGDRAVIGDGVIIEDQVEVGNDTVVEANSRVERGVKIGNRVHIGAGVIIEPGCKIPTGSKIPAGMRITPKINTMILESISPEHHLKLVQNYIELAKANAKEFSKSPSTRANEIIAEEDKMLTSAGVLEKNNHHWDTFVNVNPNPIIQQDRPGLIFDRPE